MDVFSMVARRSHQTSDRAKRLWRLPPARRVAALRRQQAYIQSARHRQRSGHDNAGSLLASRAREYEDVRRAKR
jgi:hypothetical protein